MGLVSTTIIIVISLILSISVVSAKGNNSHVTSIGRPEVNLDILWRGSNGRRMAQDENFRVKLTRIQTLSLDTFRPSDAITGYLTSRNTAPPIVTAVTGQRIFSARWMGFARFVATPENAENTVCMVMRRQDVRSQALLHQSFGTEHVFPFELGQSVNEVERAVGIECTAYYINRHFESEFGSWVGVDQYEYLKKYE